MDKQTAKMFEVVSCGCVAECPKWRLLKNDQTYQFFDTEAKARAKAAKLRAIDEFVVDPELAAAPQVVTSAETRPPLQWYLTERMLFKETGEPCGYGYIVDREKITARAAAPPKQFLEDMASGLADACGYAPTEPAETRPPDTYELLMREILTIRHAVGKAIPLLSQLAPAHAAAPVEPPPCQDCEEVRKRFFCPKHDTEDTEYVSATEPVKQCAQCNDEDPDCGECHGAAARVEQPTPKRETELLEALHEYDILLEQLDEALASPEEIERDTKAVGGYVSGLNLTYGANTVLKKAIERLKSAATARVEQPAERRKTVRKRTEGEGL